MRFFMLIASGLMLGACGDASNLEKTESFEGKLRATYGEKAREYGIRDREEQCGRRQRGDRSWLSG